jgi:hypothetical protein
MRYCLILESGGEINFCFQIGRQRYWTSAWDLYKPLTFESTAEAREYIKKNKRSIGDDNVGIIELEELKLRMAEQKLREG